MANTTFYGKLQDKNKKVSWGDILSESFKKHDQMDRDRLLAVGTAAWKVNDGNMLNKWRKPWLWTRILLVFVVMAVIIALGIFVFPLEPIFYTMAMVLLPITLPLVELVLLWELNIPQNLSLWDILLCFMLGGIMSLLFSIVGAYIIVIINPRAMSAPLAPLFEEPGKLLAILIFISKVKKRNNGRIYGITGLVVGAAVGAGFSAFESIMYVLRAFGNVTSIATQHYGVDSWAVIVGMQQSLGQILMRMLSALGGHIQFAAPYAAALVYGSADNKRSGVFTGRFLITFALSCVMHASWNIFGNIWILIALIVIMWTNLLYWVNKCMKEVYAAGTSPAASMPVIRWLYGPFAGQNMTVMTGSSVHIGRSPGNQVVFPSNTAGVSRQHCVLRANPELTIEDCGSSVGTFVDGKKLVPHVPVRLASGQKVALGSNKNGFEVM